MKPEWIKNEPGWYSLPGVANIRQENGRWYVFDDVDAHRDQLLTMDGFPTLRAAKQFVAARELEKGTDNG